MAGVEDGSGVPISSMPSTSSNYGSPNGSVPDLDGMGHRSIDAQFQELRDILLPLARGCEDFDNNVKKAVRIVTTRIASVEQTVNALFAKMASFAALEQNVSTLTQNVSSLTALVCKIEANNVRLQWFRLGKIMEHTST